ncbi:MAG: hypothetical protein M1834_009752 [Cirrosporium novae-zelandiae]|nr:MAG: hypothetical protein M1834_009752 [Cirrosporium novae-zelandiae]
MGESEHLDERFITACVEELNITPSLEDLQTDEQRRVLDTIAQVRKCGLDSILSLPQLVVCGDQSAGKSSVLEALTEIPFPRNDNLCTRFATEIILRRATVNSLTIKVIPDAKRPTPEQESIKSFQESITDFDELPIVMDAAMAVMGLNDGSTSNLKAFARDVLSVEIEGPSRPQLTLVDIPGLIQTETKGVTKADVDLVAQITDQYISQSRTICLAVVSATHDYANQKILTKVREVDPEGERTLGIITKPDRLPRGSGSEKAFFALARNEDVFLKLGWHVLKNRSFEETSSSLMERNISEVSYIRNSIFSSLPEDCWGIDSLRLRLSSLLFEHVKQELPNLQEDLEKALNDAKKQLDVMGDRRTTPADCRIYLTQLSLDYYEICKAAVGGHYEGDYFHRGTGQPFSLTLPSTIRRVRAVVQFMNTKFSDNIRTNGHKYYIDMEEELSDASQSTTFSSKHLDLISKKPVIMFKDTALEWVSQAIIRTRGKELIGNFNPLLISELFWEQCSNWHQLAVGHVDQVAAICREFLNILLTDKCPKDVRSRLWSAQVEDVLKIRHKAALQELDRIMEDIRSYPINYNHYYTDVINKRRQERQKKNLADCVNNATTHVLLPECQSNHTSAIVDIDSAVKGYTQQVDPDMEKFSCEEALDCLFAIYKVCNFYHPNFSIPCQVNNFSIKVSQKTFVANITTQVIERHIVRGLEKIFSPVVVNGLSESEVEGIASEPASAKRQREFLEDRIEKLKHGQGIFKNVMGSTVF